ncbi:MAG: DoxX family membrane protein [Actinobacteria bacterium]|nr:DoxX family membrane protein [Actinomycetota bacterium]
MKILQDKKFSIVWTILRVYLGWQWLEAGWGKVNNSAWVGEKAGTAITGFLKGAAAKAVGDHPAVQPWYASFINGFALPNAKVFSYLVAFGEVLVGAALILGVLTTFALLMSMLMNLNFMLAGSTSTNPILYTIAFILILTGAASYYYGLDRIVLPKIFKRKGVEQTA